MQLRYWTRAYREVEFDVANGEARVVRLSSPRPDTAPLYGYAACERRLFGRRVWFALYRDGDDVVFQSAARRWLAADASVRFRHRRPLPFVSHFEVLVGGRRELSIRYSHLARLVWALIDTTYDGIDREHDYFLEFVAEQANSTVWRDHVVARWQSAGDA